MYDRSEFFQPRIRHGHHANIGIDRAERIVLSRNLRARQRIEKRRLADVGQTYDTAANCHVSE